MDVRYVLSGHAQDMLKERGIQEDWVRRTIDSSDWKSEGKDNNMHYFKTIDEHGGRILHVIVNPHASPKKVVTVFFDRKARRQK